jgi:exodeoxyribonuclease VII large subunit
MKQEKFVVERTFSLYELNQEIKSVIQSSFPRTYLVTAEIASMDLRRHCYMTLVDKDDEVIRAEMRGVIWASSVGRILAQFRSETGIDLVKGIRILFEASVRFHERYGLSLDILSVDPSYTIGELSARRREVLERLSREGLRERNRALEFPLVPQNIGIISSRAAAGYEDLVSHLRNNPYNFRFTCRMYEAVMQGDRAEASIVKAIERCFDDSSRLDVVVIVRGGGGQTDLHCFDSYEIARAVAHLPVPVVSGIGHLRDISVLDEVSNMRGKTPTAVADLLITKAKEFEDSMGLLANRLVHGAGRLLTDMRETLTNLARSVQSATAGEVQIQKQRLDTLSKGLAYLFRLLDRGMNHLIGSSAKMRSLVSRDIVGQDRLLDLLVSRLAKVSRGMLLAQAELLRSRQSNLDHLDPKNILKRGYTMTLKNGRICMSVREFRIREGEAS